MDKFNLGLSVDAEKETTTCSTRWDLCRFRRSVQATTMAFGLTAILLTRGNRCLRARLMVELSTPLVSTTS